MIIFDYYTHHQSEFTVRTVFVVAFYFEIRWGLSMCKDTTSSEAIPIVRVVRLLISEESLQTFPDEGGPTVGSARWQEVRPERERTRIP